MKINNLLPLSGTVQAYSIQFDDGILDVFKLEGTEPFLDKKLREEDMQHVMDHTPVSPPAGNVTKAKYYGRYHIGDDYANYISVTLQSHLFAYVMHSVFHVTKIMPAEVKILKLLGFDNFSSPATKEVPAWALDHSTLENFYIKHLAN